MKRHWEQRASSSVRSCDMRMPTPPKEERTSRMSSRVAASTWLVGSSIASRPGRAHSAQATCTSLLPAGKLPIAPEPGAGYPEVPPEANRIFVVSGGESFEMLRRLQDALRTVCREKPRGHGPRVGFDLPAGDTRERRLLTAVAPDEAGPASRQGGGDPRDRRAGGVGVGVFDVLGRCIRCPSR